MRFCTGSLLLTHVEVVVLQQQQPINGVFTVWYGTAYEIKKRL